MFTLAASFFHFHATGASSKEGSDELWIDSLPSFSDIRICSEEIYVKEEKKKDERIFFQSMVTGRRPVTIVMSKKTLHW